MADDLGKKLSHLGRSIRAKTQKTIDIVSINNDINIKERRLSDLYIEIGEAYCKAHNDITKTEFPELCAEVFSIAKDVAAMRAAVLRIKGYRECPQCREMVGEDSAYCSKCGAAIPAPVSEPAPDGFCSVENHCKNCGEELEDSIVFCPNCGTKRE